MARKYQHWYIRGWVYEDVLGRNGVKRRELVYRGEYYRPALTCERFRNLKIVYTMLMAAVYASYIFFSMRGSAGGQEAYAGAGCILAIIPLIFQGMGVASIWLAPYKMPYRDYHGAILRTKVASGITAAMLLFSAIGELVFMILYRDVAGIRWMDEWIWFGGCLVAGGISFIMFYLLHALHFDILPGQLDTTTMRRRLK